MFQYMIDDPVVLTRDGQRHLGTIAGASHTHHDGTLYTVSEHNGTSTWHRVSSRELQYDPRINRSADTADR